jgi:two-component system sensor histidine kinase DesK
VGRLAELWRSGRVVRLAPVGAVSCSALLPVVQVLLAFGYVGNDTRTGLWSLAATGAYLPLHLRHVWYAAHARRPPAGLWTFAAMAVVILGATPLAGNMWPRSYAALVVSALLVLPPPWSYTVYVAVAAAAAPVAHALGLPWTSAPWLLFSVLAASAALLLLIWLPAALTRLQAARELLAQQAVAQERRRLDDDLRQSLGHALESIAARGEQAGRRLAGTVPEGLAEELAALADDSRRTLADARQRVRGYRRPSLRAELETTTTLLAAAGIETRLELPRGEIPDTIDPRSRAALRATVTRLLRADAVHSCTITVSRDGRLRLELRTGEGAETISIPA